MLKSIRNTLLLLLALLSGHTVHAAVTELNRIVAVVNNDVITELELEQRLRQVKRELSAKQVQLPPDAALKRQLLERMIMEQLQLDLAERLNIRINDEELGTIIQNIAQRNNLTLQQFRSVLEREGASFAAFREQIRKEVLLTRLRKRQVESKVMVREGEIENFIDSRASQLAEGSEFHLAHILVSVPDGADPDTIAAKRKKAEQLLQQLRDGADFQQLAVRHSDGQQALEGGDLGWRKAAELPTLFSDIAVRMSPGDVSEALRSPSGFHIIKLLDKRGGEQHVVEQSKVRHILIRTDELTTSEEAQRRIKRLRDRILAGEDFAELARSHSDDPGSANKGGELGWADPGTFVSQFEETMKELKIGELSEPVQTQFGWHIIEVQDRRRHDNTEEVLKAQARQVLHQRKVEEETESWLRRMRDEAYVDIRLEQ